MNIVDYLIDLAPLSRFHIYMDNNSDGGLIGYQAEDGSYWNLMEDNEKIVKEAIDFLITYGAPVLQNAADLKKYMDQNKHSI